MLQEGKGRGGGARLEALKARARFTVVPAWALGGLPILRSVQIGPWGLQPCSCCG